MAISGLGRIKFFDKSQCLFADGSSMSASSGDSSSARALDRNPVTYWRSVGSLDVTTETLTITFAEEITISRLFFVDMNWKGFVAKYDVAGTYTHFASVVGLSGSMSNITETTFAKDTAYYEFTPVTTTSIQITITTTQTANDEKYVNQIIATTELGTLSGHPQIKGLEHDRNTRKKEMLSGKQLFLKSEESFKFSLDFKDYPTRLSTDLDLMLNTLFDREENFLIWLCGGRSGTTYFKYQAKGYRLKDVYTVQTVGIVKPIYSDGVYQNQINFSMAFEEAVD